MKTSCSAHLIEKKLKEEGFEIYSSVSAIFAWKIHSHTFINSKSNLMNSIIKLNNFQIHLSNVNGKMSVL